MQTQMAHRSNLYHPDMEQFSMMENDNPIETVMTVSDEWNPKVIGKLQEKLVEYIVFQGKAVRPPQSEDEWFFVLTGQLVLTSNDRFIVLNPEEFVLVPKDVEYDTIALEKVHVMLYVAHPSTELPAI